eukprot:12898271-Prorocentrum_lima.AAC.1
MKRELYTELPREHPEWQGGSRAGLLQRHLYGVRDAGQNFELKVRDAIEDVAARLACTTLASSTWPDI